MVLPGDTSDKTTLEAFLAKIEAQYGKAERVWIIGGGIPTEATLATLRGADTPVHYLVGTRKGRLSKLEKPFLALMNRSMPKPSPSPATARSCARCVIPRAATCFAPICAAKIPPSSGRTTSN